ncbi:hypothetical protein BHF71_00925 [Vulcanibacillus modesticaldus]|uniref:SLH domain-containing protein n=1 Tax=Vulcanibacillus modesticaldus TaxID=337097 RepID=A0A1D2YVL1_9BACI|nr:S-layer homology domain-containing protein [Vulcanibacillus modesticaldus]OEF99770.1 hypothetical protein BHF71_00925 [Vulcanibacillus modesticaldus]
MNSVKKLLSVMLIIVLMVGLMPPIKSQAASTPTIEIIGLYAPDASGYVNNDIDNDLKDLSLVTRKTSQSITLQGKFYNFDPAQVEKFYYTVTSVKPNGEQITVVYDKNTPFITGNNSFEFRNVILNEGLNKIIIYSVNADTSSRPGWVYYYPVTTITDLKVNDEIFVDGMIVPQDPINDGTNLVITGTAPNADSVEIQVLGSSAPYSGYFNSQTGYFQFKVDSVDSTRLADIKIDSGDQQFEIIATNDTQRMTLSRTFVYNDGTPFTFENKIANMNADGTFGELKDLVTQPVIVGDTNEVYLQGNIKVDVDPVNPSNLLFTDAVIKIPNQSGSDSVTFSLDALTVTTSGNPSLSATIALDNTRSTSNYKVYNYTIKNITIDTSKQKQSIITEFNNATGQVIKPTYYFDYVNTTLPFIEEVKFADSGIALIDDTQVNELPIRLQMVPNTTSASFSDVHIYYDSTKLLPNDNNKAEYYTATAGQTVFTLSKGYTVGNGSLIVIVNGALKKLGVDYNETDNKTVTFINPLAANDQVVFIYDANSLFETYTATAGQTNFNVVSGYAVNTNSLKVYVNGSLQTNGVDYNETDNNTITFVNPLAGGEQVTLIYDTNKVVENYRATTGQTVVNLSTEYTVGNGSLNVYLNGVPQIEGTDYNEIDSKTITFVNPLTADDVVTFSYDDKFIISWLPEGTHSLTFVPVDINGNEQLIGSVTRYLTYIPMQYIIVDNIYNGQILTDYSLNTIYGRLVNVPINNQVKAYMGDTPVPFTRNTDNTFSVDISGKLVEGKNVIIFKIVDENNDIIAESNWEIFVFTTKAPQLILDIEPSIADLFVNTEEMKEGQYSTREKSVKFLGTFVEASKITVKIYRKDENGVSTEKIGTWLHPNFNDSSNFNNNKDEFYDYNVKQNLNGTASEGNFDLTVDLSTLGTTTIQVQVTNASGIISSKTYEIVREPLPYEIIYPNLRRSNVINSNFVRIEMLAEGADAVYFKKEPAKKDWIIDRTGNSVEGFVYEVRNLKPGRNKIKFSVLRGEQSVDGEIEVYYADTIFEGAQYKTKIAKRVKVFDGLVQLEFPKGTMLRRNDDSTINPYLSDQRQILFGIAEDTYGRVDKFRHPISSELEKDYDDDGNRIDNFYPSISSKAKIGKNYLAEPTGRFRPASELIWIDAGTLRENASDVDDIIYGSGKLPYDSDDIFYERYYADQIVPTARGTITLKYDANIRADAWPYLTIYHYTYNPDKNIYEWQNIGGVVDTKKQTITAPIDSFGYFRVMYMNQSFDDVVGHSWARIDLDILYSKGVMVNKFSDQFVPEENITRGEFVTLLVKVFELPLDYEGEGTFYDVFKNPSFVGNALWEYKYIETAARYGIVRGQLEGTFAPNEPISRQDAAVMIARAANLKTSSVLDEKQIGRTRSKLQKLFTDANLINLYAAPSVEAVVKAGLMNGKPNVLLEGQKKQTYRFDPTFELKRSEAARIVINVLKQQKKIPK